jgi:hypothetical protein
MQLLILEGKIVALFNDIAPKKVPEVNGNLHFFMGGKARSWGEFRAKFPVFSVAGAESRGAHRVWPMMCRERGVKAT